MTNLKDASAAHADALLRSVREGDGWFVEADPDVNGSARQVVAAMAEAHGEAWLGLVNRYGDDRGTREGWIWKWDGQPVDSFGAAFVLPCFDERLVDLLHERDTAPYVGTAEDAKRIDAIFDRIEEIGGRILVWA